MPGENIHDKFFKNILAEKENASDFLQHYLSSKLICDIDLDSLQIEENSFIDEKLKEKSSDLLFKMKLQNKTAYIYTLFEHKSYPDKYTSMQLHKYTHAIWERHLQQNKYRGKLPIVIPIVFYHGKRKWPYGTNLANIVQQHPAYNPPDLSYIIYDLSPFSNEEIRGNVILRLSLSLLKNIFHPELPQRLPNILQLLCKIEQEDKANKIMEMTINYLLRASEKITIDKLKEIVENLPLKGAKNTMPTIAETLEEKGFLRAEKMYLAIREKEALRNKRVDRKKTLQTAMRLQQEGCELAFISKIVELDIEYLARFFQKIRRLSK
ncbi:MAG: Rpn family recombination-promoting nuclease/putative transposase [Spirochaetota bacterium]